MTGKGNLCFENRFQTAIQRDGEAGVSQFACFLFGGFICTIGQVLCQLYQNLGLELKDARAFVSVSLILISAVFTALGWYDNIAKVAGAGTLVPITGFANSMVSPAMEFKSEGFITGLGAKMFTVAGPVLVFGITASVVFGFIAFFFHLY